MSLRALTVGLALLLLLASSALSEPQATAQPNRKLSLDPASASKASDPAAKPPTIPFEIKPSDFESLKGVALIGLASMAPAALLMFTSFVRIQIVLILIRQALGSPQIPGNQVLTALALLLSLLVMQPVGESVYTRAIEPYAASPRSAEDAKRAWEAGSRPIKAFMLAQINRTRHDHYFWKLCEIAEPALLDRVDPVSDDEMPLRVVAPAFLLSELTTAMMIGFMIYLPFLVIDLVVSAVLSAMGLFMLPPSLVATPLKLILFVLADGWLLVATALLRTFEV